MLYYSFNSYLKNKYGERVQRISLNAGFSCPNKDGTLGKGGCIYCNEWGFSQFAGTGAPLTEQIERSIKDAKKNKKAKKFIAYFQNATGTYAKCEELKYAYDAIRDYPEIVALSISTRPDAVDSEKLKLIASYTRDYEVWVEYGLQTIHDKTLELINRKHTFKQSAEAIEKTDRSGIKVGVHVILGLPGEEEKDMIETARKIAELPVSGVKLHVLHVLKDTELEKMYSQGKIKLLDQNKYAELACSFLENTRHDVVILRLVSDAKDEYLISPKWINNKLEVIRQIEQEFERRGTHQGSSLLPNL